jgi:hypothetical protein
MGFLWTCGGRPRRDHDLLGPAEVLAVSDRIVVVRNGRIGGELSRSEATKERVKELAAG